MQAPLSSTASGKVFNRRPVHAVLNANPNGRLASLPGPLLPTTGQSSADSGVAEGAGLAHDAGNLLGALGLYSQLLARPGVLREEHRHYADELQMLSGRSRLLIDRLLHPATTQRASAPTSASAAQGGQQAVAVAIPEVIERCRGLLNTIARRAIAVAYEAGAGLRVAVPEEMLERILVNLTKNAAEATEGDGAIILRVTCRPAAGSREDQPQRVVLTVEDKGRGMSVAAVRRLLERPASEPTAGPRGLGFRVVRELVGDTGGQLRLESRSEGEGQGTTVEIAWAVAPGNRESAAAETARAVGGYSQHSGGNAEAATNYIPTSFSERHGLLRLAGPDTATRRVPQSQGAISSFTARAASGFPSFDAAGRIVC